MVFGPLNWARRTPHRRKMVLRPWTCACSSTVLGSYVGTRGGPRRVKNQVGPRHVIIMIMFFFLLDDFITMHAWLLHFLNICLCVRKYADARYGDAIFPSSRSEMEEIWEKFFSMILIITCVFRYFERSEMAEFAKRVYQNNYEVHCRDCTKKKRLHISIGIFRSISKLFENWF